MNRKVIVLLSAVLVLAFVLSACSQATPTQTTEGPVATEAPVATEEIAEATVEVSVPTEEVQQTEEVVSGGMVELPEVDPAAVQGDVISAGSSTVFPLAEAVATLFESEGYTGQITIDSVGTGGGFERFCSTGETDVANASRAIKDSETENCAALTPARTPIEFRVGTDALAVVVSAENDFLTDITIEELAKIFSEDSPKMVRYSSRVACGGYPALFARH